MPITGTAGFAHSRVSSVVALSIAIVALWLSCIAAAPAAQPMHFTHLGADAGLAQGGVMAIVQDRWGFLWLGSEDGLDRYDGYSTLQHAIRQRGVAGSLAQQIDRRTRHRRIRQAMDWHGRGRSRVRRDLMTGRFVPLRPVAGQPSVSSDEKVRALHLDHNGHLWIATRTAGLVELDAASGRVHRFKHTDADGATLSDDGIFAIAEGRNGALWLGTQRGLDRLDPASGRVERLGSRVGTALGVSGSVQVNAVLEDQHGDLWVGTDAGLAKLEAAGERIVAYRNKRDASGSLPSDRVQALLEDDARRLWIGTAAGLALFDRHADRFDTYRHEAAPIPRVCRTTMSSPCMRTAPACCGSARRPRAWQSGIHVHGLSGISWALVTLRGQFADYSLRRGRQRNPVAGNLRCRPECYRPAHRYCSPLSTSAE